MSRFIRWCRKKRGEEDSDDEEDFDECEDDGSMEWVLRMEQKMARPKTKRDWEMRESVLAGEGIPRKIREIQKNIMGGVPSGKCVERECENCRRKGSAKEINKRSPFTKGTFFCKECAEYDVFEDKEGCGICRGRLYVCKLSPKEMEDNIKKHGVKEYKNEVVKPPVTLERDAHETCFTTLRNRMIDRKEEEDLQKRVRERRRRKWRKD